MSKEEWLENKIDKDCDFLCKVCKYKDECHGDVKCYGGIPIFPPCSDGYDKVVDWDLVEEIRGE